MKETTGRENKTGMKRLVTSLVLLSLGTARAQDRARADLSQDAAASLALAESEFRGKRCGLALPHYAKAVAVLRLHPDGVLHYAQCAVERGDTTKIPAILSLLAPNDGEHHFDAGEMLVQHQAYAAAAIEFGTARRTAKDPYTAGYDEALAYFKAGSFAKTIETANELLNRGYRTAELADLAGNAYLKNQQPREAYNALRLATGIDPRNEDSYVDLCSIALDLGKYDLGIGIANLGLSHIPGSARLYLQRGVLHAMKGESDDAERDFAAAARVAPQDPAPQVSEAVLAMQRGDLNRSVRLLRHAVALSPGNYLAQFWFAEALLRSGAPANSKDGDEALAALERSVQSNPEFWHSRTDLGKLLLDRGDLDSSIQHLEKAAALNRAATSPLYILAQAYRRKGDTQRAQELISRVSKMQAEDRESLARSDLRHIVSEGTTSQVN